MKYYVSLIGTGIFGLIYLITSKKTYNSSIDQSSFDIAIFAKSFFYNLSFTGFIGLFLPLVVFVLLLFNDSKTKEMIYFKISSVIIIFATIFIIAYADVVTKEFRIHERYFLFVYPLLLIPLFKVEVLRVKKKYIVLTGFLILLANFFLLTLDNNRFFILPDAPDFAFLTILTRFFQISIIKFVLFLVSCLLAVLLFKPKGRTIIVSFTLSFVLINYGILNFLQFKNSNGYQINQYKSLESIVNHINKDDKVLYIYSGGDPKILWNAEFLSKGKHIIGVLGEKMPDGWDNKKLIFNSTGILENDSLFNNVDYILSFDSNTQFQGDIVSKEGNISLIRNYKQPIRITSESTGQFDDGWLGENFHYQAYDAGHSVKKIRLYLSGKNIPKNVGKINGTIKSSKVGNPVEFEINSGENKSIEIALDKKTTEPFIILDIKSNTFIPNDFIFNGDKRKLSIQLDKIELIK
jgi:hypothetical protein